MRTICLLLLLANLSLYAYVRLDNAGSGEAARLSQQVNPESIRLLTAQQVAALGPAKIAALADVCIEWGSFGDADRARALAALEPLALGRLLTQKKVDASMAYWVYLPKAVNRAAADKRLAELNAAGITNAAVVDSGPQRFALSLGTFRSAAAANALLDALARSGVSDAKAEPRQQVLSQTSLVIRDPDAAVVAKVKALQPGYPESEVKVGTCDKPA